MCLHEEPTGAARRECRPQPGQSVRLPEAPYLPLFVPRGSVDLEGAGRLETGDAMRFTATGGLRDTAAEACEGLVREVHAGLVA